LIPDASIRKDDAIPRPILRSLVQAPFELRLDTRTVFRMNPVEPERPSRDVLTRLHGVRPLNLRRTLDQAGCEIVPPASCTAEPLNLEQKGLATPQRIFCHLSVVDVGPDAIPTRLAVVVVYPHGPNLEPSILAVVTPHARLGVERLPRLHPTPASHEEIRQIVRRDDVGDVPVLRIGDAGSVILASGAVVQFELARGAVDRDQSRDVVEDCVELGRSPLVFGMFSLVDVAH
jgi:hypothetical protein